MRISLTLDSANADEAKRFIFAFQRTRALGLPASLVTEPTVRMMGVGWGITTPPVTAERATAIMCDLFSGSA